MSATVIYLLIQKTTKSKNLQAPRTTLYCCLEGGGEGLEATKNSENETTEILKDNYSINPKEETNKSESSDNDTMNQLNTIEDDLSIDLEVIENDICESVLRPGQDSNFPSKLQGKIGYGISMSSEIDAKLKSIPNRPDSPVSDYDGKNAFLPSPLEEYSPPPVEKTSVNCKIITLKLLYILFGICIFIGIVSGLVLLFLPTIEDTLADQVVSNIPTNSLTPTSSSTDAPTPSLTVTLTPTLAASSTILPSSLTTLDYVFLMQDFFSQDYGIDVYRKEDVHTLNSLAVEWLAAEAHGRRFKLDERLVQRFALLAIELALNGSIDSWNFPRNARRRVHECNWKGISCDYNGWVQEIKWDNLYQFEFGSGVISPNIGLLKDSLKVLDLSNNGLAGEIPEDLYELTKLEKLYLFKNKLEGTISPNIGKLMSLTHFHMSHNKLTGSIPEEVKSDEEIRPLRKYLLCR